MGTLQPDVQLGEWVYCESHVGPHRTGWCSVDVDKKIPLEASTHAEAFEEVKAKKLPISGYCQVCYEHIANTHHGRLTCPEHGLPR